jgi:hypothetical protein
MVVQKVNLGTEFHEGHNYLAQAFSREHGERYVFSRPYIQLSAQRNKRSNNLRSPYASHSHV